MTERILTIDDVCTSFGFSRATLHRLTNLGEFPRGLKVGRARRWSESCIRNWMTSREAGTDGPLLPPGNKRRKRG